MMEAYMNLIQKLKDEERTSSHRYNVMQQKDGKETVVILQHSSYVHCAFNFSVSQGTKVTLKGVMRL